MVFRKHVLVDTELVPVVTELISKLGRIASIEQRLSAIEQGTTVLVPSASTVGDDKLARALASEKKRADAAELAFRRLRSRRSVRLALAAARPSRAIFRAVRSWKKRR